MEQGDAEVCYGTVPGSVGFCLDCGGFEFGLFCLKVLERGHDVGSYGKKVKKNALEALEVGGVHGFCVQPATTVCVAVERLGILQ